MSTSNDDLMTVLQSMRRENETMLKESEARTAATIRDLTGNISTEISAVNVTLTTHTASIITIESRLKALEIENANWPSPSASTIGSSGFSPPSNHSAKRRMLDDSYSSGSNYSTVYATSEKSNVARLSGFPHLYTKTDLVDWAKTILAKALPDHYHLDVQAGGAAKSARIVFDTTQECADAVAHLANTTLKWTDPDDKVVHPLYFKHDSAPEIRRMGGLLSTGWKATNKVCGPLAESLGHKFDLVTNKQQGTLRMKIGHRIIDILTIDLPSTNGTATVTPAESRKGYPLWLDEAVMSKIMAIIREDKSFG